MRRSLMLGLDLFVFAFSGLCAFLLRFDFSIPPAAVAFLAYGVPIWVVTKVTVFHAAHLHQGRWRYVSVSDVVRLVFANLAASALSCVLILIAAPRGFPRSVYLLDFLVCLTAAAGSRFAIRLALESSGRATHHQQRHVFIYGAGDAGVLLLRECRLNPDLGFRVCGFIDDDPHKLGSLVQGVPVLGPGGVLADLSAEHQVREVLIAIPSASGAQMTQILQYCHKARIPCKTVPGMAEIIEHHGLANQIRNVKVEDLLGRTPVCLDEGLIRSKLKDKVVLVTGSAGSIGSEICRQMARFQVATIVGLDISETGLFHLDREMRGRFPEAPFCPEIGSIRNLRRLAEVFRQHRPAIVYHAAAYKHVPLMEAQVPEAIENNVFGTYNVAAAAAEHEVEDFVLISSDKAVRPTSVMGATKRLAELVVLAMQNGHTRYAAVRFGNVLGSNGSVIPVFKEQIAAGGPVTVTHPEMRRYFMTVPEATQLVLQASTMGNGGEIFVLDMGQPVKIVDLARNLILLSGLRPDEDIQIEFTGIRPGEKLYEELNMFEENMLPTTHRKIRIFAGNRTLENSVEAHLAVLRKTCAAGDVGQLIVTLKEIVPDYNPSSQLLRQVMRSRPPRAAAMTA